MGAGKNPSKIANALSRAPVFTPNDDNSAPYVHAISADFKVKDLAIETLAASATKDPDYGLILAAIRRGTLRKNLPPQHPGRAFSNVWDSLSIHETGLIIYDGNRIVVPYDHRSCILNALHTSHSGISKTRKLAQSLYYWPRINDDIADMINRCEACQVSRPTQAEEPFICRSASAPMESVSVDLCDANGGIYLVMVDRFSGYPFSCRLRSTITSSITKQLTTWFREYGWPLTIGSDGGPQFRSEFESFCRNNHIVHELSSPYHPQSNGLAEAAVKNVKALLNKSTTASGFAEAIQAFRNTPRTSVPGCDTPASLFFGRHQRQPKLPRLPVESTSTTETKEDGRRTLPPLRVGTRVRLQDPHSHRWDTQGRVETVRDNGRSYVILKDSGRFTTRNRRYIKPVISENPRKKIRLGD